MRLKYFQGITSILDIEDNFRKRKEIIENKSCTITVKIIRITGLDKCLMSRFLIKNCKSKNCKEDYHN
jgi:hypothetical protein